MTQRTSFLIQQSGLIPAPFVEPLRALGEAMEK